jgi:WD40 repeat protein
MSVAPSESPPKLGFSAKGRWAIVGTVVIEAATGRDRAFDEGEVTISPDERWVAVRSSSQLAVWKLEDSTRVATYQGKVVDLAFDPTSEHLLAHVERNGRAWIVRVDIASGRSWQVGDSLGLADRPRDGASMLAPRFDGAGRRAVWLGANGPVLYDVLADRATETPMPLDGTSYVDRIDVRGAVVAIGDSPLEYGGVVTSHARVFDLVTEREIFRAATQSWALSADGTRFAWSPPRPIERNPLSPSSRQVLRVRNLTTQRDEKLPTGLAINADIGKPSSPWRGVCGEGDWSWTELDWPRWIRGRRDCSLLDFLTLDLSTGRATIAGVTPADEYVAAAVVLKACARAGGRTCHTTFAEDDDHAIHSADGRAFLAPVDDRVAIVELESGKIRVRLAESSQVEPGKYESATFSPDDAWLLATDSMGQTRLWDARTGAVVWRATR